MLSGCHHSNFTTHHSSPYHSFLMTQKFPNLSHPCLATKPTTVFYLKTHKKITFLWDLGVDHCAMHTVRLPTYGILFLFALHFPPSSPNHKTQGTSFPFTLLLLTPKPTDHCCSELFHLFSLCRRHGTHVRQLPPSSSLTTNPTSTILLEEATAPSSSTLSPLKLSPDIYHPSFASQG